VKTPPLTVTAARTVLAAVLREQLAACYARGVEAVPHGINALHDPQAPQAFAQIMTAVTDLTQAVARHQRDLAGPGKKPGTL